MEQNGCGLKKNDLSGEVGGGGRIVEVEIVEGTLMLTFESIFDAFSWMLRFLFSSVLDSKLQTSGGMTIVDSRIDIDGVSTFMIYVSTSNVFTWISKMHVSSIVDLKMAILYG